MTKFEKPQKGNPHQLVVNQHTFPARSIARFANSSGTVQLRLKADSSVREARPTDSMFCARRVWDQSSEALFCKKIEDDFQRLADLIVSGLIVSLNKERMHAISSFYALWVARTQLRDQPEKDLNMPGIWPDETRSKEQEEALEKAGYTFTRGNLLPARMVNGLAIRAWVMRHLRQVSPTAHWGIIYASGGEFIVPDCSLDHSFVPISPHIALANNASNQRLDNSAVRLVNEQLRSTSIRYFFARDFAACP
ncbi:hypothetical protein [Bradyrhizobium sp. HKCCYLS20291]|uniref:hypothetical protein n=1 Tax=Bradyrhizobium sp. HKCCYLS20291 TaxID=3420766 RepID=UPI003EC1013D